ncbi:MAG: hypothetical protein J5I47_08540 [Vicingus serpentipes]|nr:hypothetical protein [Vicingus serpentipes]
MINKLKKYFKSLKIEQQQLSEEIDALKKQTQEIEWAHIYHDSIRGKKWLEELPLNIGRWACNYSFFYVLNRVLNDYKPSKILELGLGESTKVISSYLDNELKSSTHLVIEQNQDWANLFEENFKLSDRSTISICPIEIQTINSYQVRAYKDFKNKVENNYDLYIVDGPHGSDRYSRYDIVQLIKNVSSNEEFIILFDDTDRKGEDETCTTIAAILEEKKIPHYIEKYGGIKSSTIIATEKYKYSTSL